MRRLLTSCLVAPALLLGACATNVPVETSAPTSSRPSAVSASASASGRASTATPAAGAVSCTYTTGSSPAKPVDPPSGENVPATGQVVATVTTNQGPVTITMDRSKTPCTVNSFLSLAQQKFFDNTRCHRLVDKGIFVLQCGDPSGTGSGGPGYTYKDETYPTDTYPAGTVAMANSGPDTNGSQFFFVYQDSPLPPSYTVFGTIDQTSLGVIARIAAEGQDGSSSAGGGKPNNDALIETVAVG